MEKKIYLKIVYAKDINEIIKYIKNHDDKNYIIPEKYLKDKIIGLNVDTKNFLKGYAFALNIKILKDWQKSVFIFFTN